MSAKRWTASRTHWRPAHLGQCGMAGVVTVLYSHSLSVALLLMFAMSFLVHAWSGPIEFSQDQLRDLGGDSISMLGYMMSARFLLELLDNWQSEFLDRALVVLAVFLREKGSKE